MQEVEEALGKFIIEQQESLYRVAYSYVKEREGALDVVQETILKSYEKLDTLRQVAYMRTWFYRILINEAITYLRKRRKWHFIEDFQKQQSYTLDQIDEEMMIYEMVVSLRPKYRTVIILRYFEDMKIGEIASVLQCPESTVKSRIKKGLTLLKEQIEKGCGDEGKVIFSSEML
ncbi:MAG: sigma-70 family RNA polymerase sigma factor [Cellulosilyticaceae bacterium]